MSIKQEKKNMFTLTYLGDEFERNYRSSDPKYPASKVNKTGGLIPTHPLVKRIESSEDFSCGKRFFSSDIPRRHRNKSLE